MTYRFIQQSVQLLFGSFRLHPSGVTHNILGVCAIIKILRGLSVFPGRHPHDFDKAAVKTGDRMETYGFRYIQDGILGALQQVTCVGNPGMVYKIQRRNMHNIAEYSAEVSGTPVAQIRQVLNRELLTVILFNKVKSGSNSQGVALFLFFIPAGGGLRPHINRICGSAGGNGGG